jgi:hypothetical protein
MMMRCLLAIAALSVISLFPTYCQSTKVNWYAFAGGFAIPTSSITSSNSAIGQSFVGSFQQANTQILSGFLAEAQVRGNVVSVGEQPVVPLVYALMQNYPNPFNPTTLIQYTVPERIHVSLKVYNVLGQEVALLVNEEKTAGRYDARFDAKNLSSGAYFYLLRAGSFVQLRKLMLLK